MYSNTIGITYCLLLGASLCIVEARWTARPRRTTTPRTSTTMASDRHQHVHHWPPLVAPPKWQQVAAEVTAVPIPNETEIRLIEGFEQRSPNGQHEFRYELSNGDTRYERTYWLPVGKNMVLARRGFYSVPLPNAQYSTVFYRADHHGYHVDTHTLSGQQPLLPRTLDVPHDIEAVKSTPTAKRNSISVPERNDSNQRQELEQHPDALATANAFTAARTSTNNNNNTNTTNNTITTKVKVQAEADADVKVQSHAQLNKQRQDQTVPSTVAEVEDILAAKVGTAADDDDAEDDDDYDAVTAAAKDDDDAADDDDVAGSNINVN